MVAFQATTKWSFEGCNLPIDTVTIYRPSEAQVVRILDLDLGERSFEGSNLPIDTVTIYDQSEAQVIRKLDLDLEVCRDLPRHPPADIV